MKTLALSAFALAFLALAVDKIRNEHRMTAMYERQAVALETIALGVQGIELQKHPEAQTMSGNLFPNKALPHDPGDDFTTCFSGRQATVRDCAEELKARKYPSAALTMEQLADQAMKETDADFCRNHKWPKEIEREQCGSN